MIELTLDKPSALAMAGKNLVFSELQGKFVTKSKSSVGNKLSSNSFYAKLGIIGVIVVLILGAFLFA